MDLHGLVGEFYHSLLSKTTRSLLIYLLKNPHTIYSATYTLLFNKLGDGACHASCSIWESVFYAESLNWSFQTLQCIVSDLYVWAPQPQRTTSTKRSDSKSQKPFCFRPTQREHDTLVVPAALIPLFSVPHQIRGSGVCIFHLKSPVPSLLCLGCV